MDISIKKRIWGSVGKINSVCIMFLFLFTVEAAANDIVSGKDIADLSEKTGLTYKRFMQESFLVRMRWELGGIANEDVKKGLSELVEKADGDLEGVLQKQRNLKKRIENYDGDDWDDRYGKSGLWRELARDVYRSDLSRCEIELYRAICSPEEEKSKILHKLLLNTESLEQTYNTGYLQFLKYRILVYLSQENSDYKMRAEKELGHLSSRSDIEQSLALKMAMERVKLLGRDETGQLKEVAEIIAKGGFEEEFGLAVRLAILQLRLGDHEGFEETAAKFPQTKDFLGELLLWWFGGETKTGISIAEAVAGRSVFEIELAVEVLYKTEGDGGKALLEEVVKMERFRTPLVLYVCGVKMAGDDLAMAVELLVEASILQQKQRSGNLSVGPAIIAEQAARLGYDLFVRDGGNCALVLRAFENYMWAAGEKTEQELEYFYGSILNECGQLVKGRGVLEKIAGGDEGKWSRAAKLELVRNQDSMEKVLDILGNEDIANDPELNLYKVKALRLTGRLSESVRCLLTAEGQGCEYAGEAMELAREVVGRIEQFHVDDSELVNNCGRLARLCYGCFNGVAKQKAGLLLIEISIFTKQDSDEIDRLLEEAIEAGLSEDIDLIRCKARVLAMEGKFAEAARLWAAICRARRDDTATAKKRSWRWWRAKFYELQCWSRQDIAAKQQALHTIEVLENSFTDIPTLWAEKLRELSALN